MLSKFLGYLIILGAAIVKVPQIMKILKANSVAGLSLEMFVLEIIGYTICTTYGMFNKFPFSTYGETSIIAVQNLVIIYLIFTYRNISMLKFGALILVIAVQIGAAMNGLISSEIFTYMNYSTSLIFCASKIPQIITNFQYKSTGTLALFTFVLNFAGSLARIFTTLKEVSDMSVLMNFILGAVLNGTIMVQILMWGPKTTEILVPARAVQKKNQ